MKAAFALLLVATVDAHIALWHPSIFGYNFPHPAAARVQNYNNNKPVNPMRGMDKLPEEKWFGGGLRNYPPAFGDFLPLEVGKVNTFEIACNRAFTTYGDPNNLKPKHKMACEDDTGPLHNVNPINTPYDKLNMSLFGGTALAIAYTSDEKTVKPADFAIISVNYTSPWYREVDYDIPATLPPCPDDGCLCTWNWMHRHKNGEGYGSEFYNPLYRCMVLGAKKNKLNTIAAPKPPVDCEGDPDKCVQGPKQGMFLYMVSGNNMQNPQNKEVVYNQNYGFKDGVQDDVVTVNSGADKSPVPTMALAIALIAGLLPMLS